MGVFFFLLACCALALGQEEEGAGLGRPSPAPAEGEKKTTPSGPQPVSLTAEGFLRMETSEDGQEQLWAKQGVHVQHQDLDLQAEELWADLGAETLRVQGQVVALMRGRRVTCEEASLNLKTDAYTVRGAQVELSPEFVGGGVQEALYMGTREAEGEGEKFFRGQRVSFTSCDLEKPHYHLPARQVTVYPGKRLILHHAGLNVGGTRLLTVPRLVLPLRQFQRRGLPFMPDFGRNDVEGYYLKLHYFYEAGANADGGVQLDLLEKQGLRLGVEYSYRRPEQRGMLDLDYSFKTRSLSARVDHSQRFSREFNATLNADYSERNAFYYNSRILNSNVRLNRTARPHTTNLSFRAQDNNGRDSVTANLQHAFQPQGSGYGARTSGPPQVNLRADFVRRPVSGPVDDQELDTQLHIEGQAPNLQWTLVDERRFDLDGDQYTGDSFYSKTETVPRLTLMSDARRLKWNLPSGFFANLNLDFGQFRETKQQAGQPQEVNIFRSNAKIDLRTSNVELAPGTTVDFSGTYDQSFHSDNTALYSLRANTSLRSYFGGGWQADVSHYYQRGFGYSPLPRFGYVGRSDSLTLRMNYRWPHKLEVGLNTGYDLLRSLYRPLSITLRAIPSAQSRLTINTGYELHGRGLRDVNAQYVLNQPEKLSLSLSTSYEPTSGKLRTARNFLSWRLSRLWRVETATEYNGFQKKVTYNDVLLTYDLHCWEAVVVYNKQRNEFRFDLNLKAYPRQDFGFGIGQFGQQFTTDLGGMY